MTTEKPVQSGLGATEGGSQPGLFTSPSAGNVSTTAPANQVVSVSLAAGDKQEKPKKPDVAAIKAAGPPILQLREVGRQLKHFKPSKNDATKNATDVLTMLGALCDLAPEGVPPEKTATIKGLLSSLPDALHPKKGDVLGMAASLRARTRVMGALNALSADVREQASAQALLAAWEQDPAMDEALFPTLVAYCNTHCPAIKRHLANDALEREWLAHCADDQRPEIDAQRAALRYTASDKVRWNNFDRDYPRGLLEAFKEDLKALRERHVEDSGITDVFTTPLDKVVYAAYWSKISERAQNMYSDRINNNLSL